MNSFWIQYGLRRVRLGTGMTGNLGVYRHEFGKWRRLVLPLRVVHFTLQKPWERCKGRYMQFCATWACFWDDGVGRALAPALSTRWARDEQPAGANASQRWASGWWYNSCNRSLDLVRRPECAHVLCSETRGAFSDCACPPASEARRRRRN